MPSTLTLSFKELTDELNDIIDVEVKKFFSYIYTANPVDTGDMKGKWTFSPYAHEWVWNAHNSADYADIIGAGRRKVGNRWYGSIQGWGNAGINTVLLKLGNIIERKTKNVTK